MLITHICRAHLLSLSRFVRISGARKPSRDRRRRLHVFLLVFLSSDSIGAALPRFASYLIVIEEEEEEIMNNYVEAEPEVVSFTLTLRRHLEKRIFLSAFPRSVSPPKTRSACQQLRVIRI